jgi:subtilisin-like proprotein convertase family protein
MDKFRNGSMSRSACARVAVLVTAALLAFPGALAATGKQPVSFSLAGGLAPAEVKAWTSPDVDVARLLAEDAANVGPFDIPLRIGQPMSTDLEPGTSGTWTNLADGSGLWRLRLGTRGALWMVLGFDAFRLQDGGEMWVYDPARTTVLGPYTNADVRDHGELWTPPIEGDELVVELLWPAPLRSEMPRIHLGTVSHGYKPFGTIGRSAWLERQGEGTAGSSGSCNIDVACPLGADWQDEKRSVVILLSGGSSFCTGAMINNTANNCAPYVLTAAHCTAGTSTQFGFNYERSGCGTGDPAAPTTYMVSGATVRGNYSSSDFTLVEMSSLPPESFNFYFGGWSHDPAPATMTWVIHHPNGDFKKISHDVDPPIDGSNYGPNHWRIQAYEQGTTEPGSSGSPLFDQNSRIVGQLHGGTASCTSITYDEYGKVSASWTGGGTAATRLSNWLDPLSTGAMVWDGLNGSTCFFQPAGTIGLNRSRYACFDTVAIHLRDDNLKGNATQAVTIASTTESAPETVLLSAIAPGSGEFQGSIPTSSVPAVHGDGLLSVLHGDGITATYIDADDGAGGTNVPRTANATTDCAPPVISAVASTDLTGNTARITWTTDEPADSRVRYGTSPPPSGSTFAAPLVTAHSMTVGSLTECTHYVYSVESADASANGASDDAGGAYYAFDTLKNTNPSYPSSGAPISIPDNSTTGATSTIAVSDVQTVLEVKVTANVTHTFDGDLELSLIAPNGTIVPLSTRRGSSGDNFTSTVFDDAAATAISAGVAPFTGSYRPESPLAAVTGISAAGNWQLKVADRASTDTGTLDSWTLTLRYAAAACGPHAKYRVHTLVQDACSAGGAGAGNGIWDAGETVQFSVTLENDGTQTLTGLTATLVPTTPGVTMITPTASYASLAPTGTAVSNAPHFKAVLPASLACGGTISFNLAIASAQGNWAGTLSQALGQLLPGGGTVLDEAFTAGIPATWSVVDGGSGGGAAATWTTANPGARTPTAPITSPFAIVDSDNAGTGSTQDEQLITPVIDLSSATTVTLVFDQYFDWYSSGQAEVGDVDVRSSLTGNAWVNVFRNQGASSANPDHRPVDLTSRAAGASNVQVRFHYYSGSYEWYWEVDNVKVTYTAPSGCSMNVCLAPPAAPPPVPDGSFGSAAGASRTALDGSSIQLTWDVTTCVAGDYHALYGPLSGLATYTVAGAACDLGTAGTYAWTGVPAGDLWFAIVADDNAGTEGTWGQASSGAPMGGTGASGLCSMTTRNNSGTCP